MTGWQTLLYKEVLRFWKVAFQTIAGPVLTAMLYLLIFGHALEAHVKVYDRVSYSAFLVQAALVVVTWVGRGLRLRAAVAVFVVAAGLWSGVLLTTALVAAVTRRLGRTRLATGTTKLSPAILLARLADCCSIWLTSAHSRLAPGSAA